MVVQGGPNGSEQPSPVCDGDLLSESDNKLFLRGGRNFEVELPQGLGWDFRELLFDRDPPTY